MATEAGAGAGRLAGKVAVITGATSGLGRAGAIRFGAEGAKVGREKRVSVERDAVAGTRVTPECYQ